MISSIDITLDNINVLEEFITKNIEGAKYFRYYNKRSYDVIKNHIKTKLYFNNAKCIGYGHLDYEEKIWLGIMVADDSIGKKYGNFIMDDLSKNIEQDIFLSVDKTNISAINLYEKKKFEIIQEYEDYFLMLKK